MTDIATVQLARVRRERIRLGMHSFIATRKDIADAYRERDWETLGHASWEAYIEAEFSEAQLRLTTDERREAVAELRLGGMSQRAIGSALGVDHSTVLRDLRSTGASAPVDKVTSLDGRERPATQPARTQTPGPVDKASPVDPGVTPAPAVEAAVLPREPDQPHPQATVAAALDAHVPDLGAAERAWRSNFYAAIKAPHELLLRLNADEIARYADEQDVQTLRLLVDGFTDLGRRVTAARSGNVRQLRRVQ